MKLSALFSHVLFAGVSEQTMRALTERYPPVRVASGLTLENTDRYLSVLLSGRARILSGDSGRTVILRTLGPVDVFGAAQLFCRDAEPFSRIETLTACKIWMLPAEAVREWIHADPVFCENYLSFLSERVRFLNRKICGFTAGSAERRLALWLSGESEDDIVLPASLSALSDMLDIGRASLYRAFERLAADGMIEKSGRNIRILDRPALLKKYQ